MASVHKEVQIDRPAAEVFDAIRDVGAIHTRLARDFVVDTRLEGDSRIVTFSTGAVARERIVTVDDPERRIAYSVIEGRFTHHNASIQVIATGKRTSRLLWTADLLPDTLAGFIDGMMEQGGQAMKRTLEALPLEAGAVQSGPGPDARTAR